MENQHRKITGYRELSQSEIDLMNEGKALGSQISALIDRLERAEFAQTDEQRPDPRSLSIAKTNLQQGMMWLVRSIAKPQGF